MKKLLLVITLVLTLSLSGCIRPMEMQEMPKENTPLDEPSDDIERLLYALEQGDKSAIEASAADAYLAIQEIMEQYDIEDSVYQEIELKKIKGVN